MSVCVYMLVCNSIPVVKVRVQRPASFIYSVQPCPVPELYRVPAPRRCHHRRHTSPGGYPSCDITC
uniref:Uncharacterized protein n=1 Tax=Leptobrachium leishanense TaxID=445787 RepID=A0A8C5LN99_9ANUR